MFVLPPYPESFLKTIREGNSFIVIGHVSPDGDCLMSQLALASLLERMGKKVCLANAGPFERKEIKENAGRFVSTIPSTVLKDNPTVIITDCSTFDRIGSLYDQVKDLKTLVIDHHASGKPWGDLLYIVGESPSTTLLIQHLFHAFSMDIALLEAKELFFGFATDTGYFRFLGPGKGEALRMAAELVDKGVSPNEVNMEMTGGQEFRFIKYLGILLNRSQRELDGKVCCSYAYLSDEKEWGTDKPSDLLYTQLLSISGNEVVLLFKEKENGKTEVGCRSSHKSIVDVGVLAASYGGGGHCHASGMTVDMPIPQIKKLVLEKIKEMLV